MTSEGDDPRIDLAMRWRLVLGRHSEAPLPLEGEDGDRAEDSGTDPVAAVMGEARALDASLDYIYDREFTERSHQQQAGSGGAGLSIPAWLSGVRRLFPREAVEVLERDALHRYGLTELVTDPEILGRATPSQELVKAILQFKHKMRPDVLEVARGVVREVVEGLSEALSREAEAALHGRTDARERPPPRTWRNLDHRRTIRRNLRHWDTDNERLVLHDVHFHHRSRQRGRWRVIVAVDQSGSMLDSLIHAAVTAAVFTGLPALDVKLLLWDHRLVDLSAHAADPLDVLMGAQLGGGTELLPALRWCAEQVVEPERTLLIVISDWFVWSHKSECLALAKELHDAGVRCLGLCALDTSVRPVYDEAFARRLADAGWFVAALTPRKLVERVGKILR